MGPDEEHTRLSGSLFEIGTIFLGKYEVERVLGKGGMGVVLAVRHRDLDELFALKVLHPRLNAQSSIIARFVREARTAARLTSDHVARVHDVGRLDDAVGTFYMLMEHLVGQDLGEILSVRKRLPLDEVLEFILQACDGLTEAHALGLVHRDLKPANMFVTHRHTGEAQLKLLDFGVTKHLHAEELTLTGSLIGTPRYMSPEQLRSSRGADARSDIWALGVILYELTTGQRPFAGDSLTVYISDVLTRAPAAPRNLLAELPPEFDAIVLRCLEKDPERRYASLAPLMSDLRVLQAHLRTSSSSAPPPAPPPAPPLLSAPLERPSGIVGSESPFYVSRPELEKPCIAEIVKDGALLRIKGPRQTGKTTLMARLLEHAADSGARTVRVDLQLADARILGDLNQLLQWICAVVRRRLDIVKIDEEWDDVFGPKDNCLIMFEDYFLPAAPSPLVLALLSVDRLFEWPQVADEFLTLLRGLHEMSKSQRIWAQLRLVLEYSTEMYVPMDINHSPLNVGLAVQLGEWDHATVAALARRHGLAWGESEVTELMGLIGGHPYLVRVALYHLAQGMTLEQLLANATTAEGVFAEHLQHLLWRLHQQPELAAAAGYVLAASEPIRLDTELAFKLVSLGLVHRRGSEVEAGREIYRCYLSRHLSRS